MRNAAHPEYYGAREERMTTVWNGKKLCGGNGGAARIQAPECVESFSAPYCLSTPESS